MTSLITAQPATGPAATDRPPMTVRVLGCSGAIARDCRTTSFLVGGDLLVDAGTGVGDLTLAEMAQISHVLLTHSHLDHIAALPLMLDAAGAMRHAAGKGPVEVLALQETIAALQAHVFNGTIWPDFTRLPSRSEPFLRFKPIQEGDRFNVAGKAVEALPAVHTVPAVGYAIEGRSGHWVFTGDTERNPAFWQRINRMKVAALVIETAFSDRERELARRSLHLSPQSLAEELSAIDPAQTFPIYVTHTKPAETATIMREIDALAASATAVPGFQAVRQVRPLAAGMEIEL